MTEPLDADALFMKAKSDALRLISVRPRSVEEMRARLEKKQYGPELAARVIELLTRQGLLDDEKFAKARATSKMYSKPLGKRALERDLARKGLAPELVARTMRQTADYDEKEAARGLVRPRLRAMEGLPREKKKARIYGFLMRRGFSSDTIFEVIDQVLNDTAE